MNQYYAIKAPDGTLLHNTVGVTEEDSLKRGIGYWYHKGYRCVKVEIKEIK